MDEDEDMSPFWLQTSDHHRRSRRLRRQASSIFLNSGVALIILLVVAFVFVFIIVPKVANFTAQVFKPNLIKKSWDSLNLVLVLFAIVCGFLGRHTTNNSNTNSDQSPTYQRLSSSSSSNAHRLSSHPSTPSHRWHDHDHHQQHQYQYQDRTASFNTLSRLRSFSSYPDLRQESLWVNNDDQRWKFYDDTHLRGLKYSYQENIQKHKEQEQEQEPKKQEEQENVISKDIAVDKEVTQATPESPPPPPPPRSPPPVPLQPSVSPPKVVPRKSTGPSGGVPVRRKVKRTYHDVERRKEVIKEPEVVQNFYVPPASPPPPPPPPPTISSHDKRRGKDLLTSLRRKRKKQRQKSVENLESLYEPEDQSIPSFIPPPPPPPPPPHFLQTLFSTKKSKTKKTSAPPPTPPPPPPVFSYKTRNAFQETPVAVYKPSKLVKTSNFSSVEDNVESGNASPIRYSIIPIPPPPPPPPFKMKSWKFIQEGDYVRLASFNSSRSDSPDLDSVEDPSSDKDSSPMHNNSTVPSMFCPSPDVNTKAENFIARFRAGLNLEKNNSVKARSNLYPAGPDGSV